MIHDSKRKGFTLIEVLVVSTIIAVMAAIGLVSYSSASRRSRDAKRKADIAQIQAALEMYRTDIGSYPTSIGGNPITSLVILKNNGYIQNIPVDPVSTKSYYYEANATFAYSYVLMAKFDGAVAPTDISCTPTTGYDYCVKNP
jgi:general secretion pathway protein G